MMSRQGLSEASVRGLEVRPRPVVASAALPQVAEAEPWPVGLGWVGVRHDVALIWY